MAIPACHSRRRCRPRRGCIATPRATRRKRLPCRNMSPIYALHTRRGQNEVRGVTWAHPPCRCGTGEPSPGADVAGTYRTQRVSSLRGESARPPTASPSTMSPAVTQVKSRVLARCGRSHHVLSVRRPAHNVTAGFAYNARQHATAQRSKFQHKTARCLTTASSIRYATHMTLDEPIRGTGIRYI